MKILLINNIFGSTSNFACKNIMLDEMLSDVIKKQFYNQFISVLL